ncbi:Uncharacterized protein TCM_024691 [Theobroma cacao]|uniref:Uncharacterized protein n=1 Tax=Theobroma cacao TaxID=3641 RepID=A0A061EWU9_THECC|nr:Uncharacterized protein TCM_024691 [Theobroma cacao]
MQGPIFIGSSMSPTTSLVVPSKALTTMRLVLIYDTSTGNLVKVERGMTFKAEPLSTKTLGTAWSLHLMVMCSALLLPRPPDGISSSLKAMKFPTVMFPTMWSNFSTDISCAT